MSQTNNKQDVKSLNTKIAGLEMRVQATEGWIIRSDNCSYMLGVYHTLLEREKELKAQWNEHESNPVK